MYWLAIGDSITFGEDEGRNSYADYLGLKSGVIVEKRAWGGLEAKDLLRLIGENFLVVDNKPNVVTVLIGANDFGFDVPLSEYENNLNQFVSRLKQTFPESRIILLTPLYRDYFGTTIKTMGGTVNNLGTSLYEYKDAVIRCANANGVEYIDLTNDKYLNVGNIRECTLDGLHPNSIGNQMIADKLYAEVVNK